MEKYLKAYSQCVCFYERAVTIRNSHPTLEKHAHIFPTDPFTILEPHEEIDVFYAIQERRATDFEAQNCKRVGGVTTKTG